LIFVLPGSLSKVEARIDGFTSPFGGVVIVTYPGLFTWT